MSEDQETAAQFPDIDPQLLIEAMQQMAAPAPEPGDFHVRDVIHKGDEQNPMPIVASSLQSAGYVFIYDLRTGDRSVTSRNLLHAQTTKLDSEGHRMFTTVPPKAQPARQTYKCLLHPESETRSRYDELGFGTCRKANLRSPLDLELHMRHRHKTEWETIEKERKDKQAEEDRELQRAFIQAAMGNVARAEPEPVASGRTKREKAG